MKPNCTKVTWRGVRGPIAAPLEEWSFSVHVATDVAWNTFDDAQMDQVAIGARTAFTSALLAVMQADCHLTETRVAVLETGGKTATRDDGSYLQGITTTTATGTGITNSAPLQSAIVVTLDTARPGPTGRGRFFLPFPALSISSVDKALSPADTTNLANAVKNFLIAVDGLGAGYPVVASSKGYLSAVNAIRIGRYPDTLRSRRERLPEGYVRVAL